MKINDYKRGLTSEEYAKVLNDCIGKVEGLNDLDWDEIVTKYNLGIHRDVLRKAFQSPMGGYSVYKYLQEEQINNVELEELEAKRKEIEIMKIQYQDQKREYRNFLRMDARWQHMIDEMKMEISKLKEYNPINDFYSINKEGKIGSLLISDVHFGMINNTSINVYDGKVAKYRFELLLSKTLEYCELNNVKELNVELLGDLIHGLIHLGTRINAEEDVLSQTMNIAEILSDFIFKLSKRIPSVIVHSTLGNHSRVSANIKENIDVENFERLITWFMKERLNNIKNISIIDNYENDIILYKIFDMNIIGVHGHKDKPKNAINNMESYLHLFIDEIHMGHYHQRELLTDNNRETIINGSFCGADEYAESLRKCSYPSQTLIIYNKEGQECIYNIKLK